MNKEELEDLLSIGCCKYHEEIGEKANKEIKRLQHNQEVSTKWEIKLTQKNTKLIEENKRLKSIIKEVREYINKYGILDLNGYDLLELLDKVNRPTIKPYKVEDNMKIGDTFIVGGE